MSDNRKWAIVIEKNVIKKFAIEARRELLSRVSQRALKYGISEKELGNPNDDSVGGHLLSSTEKSQRAALIKQIQEKGYEQVMEEVAYTWFNRFSALRFMEVNGFLPTRVRVFTDENNAFKPQILTEAIHMELDGLDMEKVYAYKEANDDDALYKYLLITQCNALNSVLPGMFQRIADYTELLFPDNLLREGSVVQQMVTLIPEDDWKDAVQIIGWLYQYYNSEKKDDVFAALKKNVKITKENIPAATQLFTPDWIVRYMVENSLGRLWIEGHPNDELKGQGKYYLEEAEQAVKSMMEDKMFGESGSTVVVEEFLTGPEVSVLSFTDGKTVVPMVSSMDHKRALDQDKGLNTGGMGTVAPNPYYTKEIADTCMETIFLPTIRAMQAEGRPFQGCLYFGLMLTPNGPKVIEYNCRFGDPETQVVLPLLETDLVDIMRAISEQKLAELPVVWKNGCAACVVMASGGYPKKYETGLAISGLDDGGQVAGCTVYHAGTKLAEDGQQLLTAGGRVLGVTATAENLPTALEKAYAGVAKIHWENVHYRHDIGQRALQALQ